MLQHKKTTPVTTMNKAETNNAETMLYFAYGSNMALERLQARIASTKKRCNARLPGHKLTFHKKGMDSSGKCDVVATGSFSDCVYGVVFEFHSHEKTTLDAIEGPRYEGKVIDLVDENNRHLQAYIYVVADKKEHTDASLKPFDWYHHHVLYGAQQAKLPCDYIQNIADIDAEKDADKERYVFEMSIYSNV